MQGKKVDGIKLWHDVMFVSLTDTAPARQMADDWSTPTRTDWQGGGVLQLFPLDKNKFGTDWVVLHRSTFHWQSSNSSPNDGPRRGIIQSVSGLLRGRGERTGFASSFQRHTVFFTSGPAVVDICEGREAIQSSASFKVADESILSGFFCSLSLLFEIVIFSFVRRDSSWVGQ